MGMAAFHFFYEYIHRFSCFLEYYLISKQHCRTAPTDINLHSASNDIFLVSCAIFFFLIFHQRCCSLAFCEEEIMVPFLQQLMGFVGFYHFSFNKLVYLPRSCVAGHNLGGWAQLT